MAETTNGNNTATGGANQAATMEEYQNSGYYQNLGIDKLQQQLAGYPVDDATLQQQAQNQYKPTYDAEMQAIQQQLALQTQGYGSQIAGMNTAYEQQKRKTNQAYDESAVNLNNALTKRGLGRSSLISTQGAYLENQRNMALGDIDANQTAAINAINEKIALLTDQAAQREQTLAGNYARQLENRVNELREQNRTASISLQLQIAALQQQGYEAYQKWLIDQRKQELAEQEFRAEHPELFEENDGAGSGGTQQRPTAKQPQKNSVVSGALKSLLNSVNQTLTLKKPSTAQKNSAKKSAQKTGKKPMGFR